MRLQEIYEKAVALGMEADPRGISEMQGLLERTQKEFEELSEADKIFYDQEQLTNPFSDTRILWGSSDLEIRRILVGIDMEVGEIVLADRLREKGTEIDLLLAHHPEGKALAALHEVMRLKEDVLYQLGVPINVAQGILASRISEVQRGMLPANHNRAVRAAELLHFPFMCVHTPADNLVNQYLHNYFAQKNPYTVGDVVKALKEIEEYQEAIKIKAGPHIVVGSEKKRAGKVFVDMTGGTSGSEKAYAKLAQAGVGTVVAMHMPEKSRTEAEKNYLNVVIAGHMASDSLGINLFLDHIVPVGIEVIPCSGFIRVQRG